ncbi:NCS2 family permease [Gracilibacillus caseinilyticus]|uniref:NCS2 family permease n=1 Tax=Gracilibacillus caseinilyticus TaxID=2932256 RepID=A0ABY4ESI5_9BACI|nr:NCS2 family permease [Gracilibacillus caseinilyticus]UOQ46619.1 NCS2 family permease [Gracilibacillus caseinilyticus]
MRQLLEKLFHLKELNTNIRTELMAGLTTFITMAYIIIVQPSLMTAAGMPAGAVMVSTIIVSGIFTIIMGVFTNRPFALAPGMGGNAFFAYSIVAAGLATWQTALGMVLISGVVFLILTLLGIRDAIAEMIPKNIKLAIGAAVGIFIAAIGLTDSGLVVLNIDSENLTLGSLHDKNVILALIGLIVILGLMARKVKGAVLYGIFITTIIGIPLGITQMPDSFFELPPSPSDIVFQVDWMEALKWSFFPLMFTFFVGDFFSTVGTLLGVGGKAGMLNKDGNLPDIKKPFLVDAVASVGGSFMGVTTVTTYIESASGVEAGGRSGLTSVSTGFIFLLCLLLTPILLMIPSVAIAPALIIVGISMLSGLKNIEFDEVDESMPAFITVIVTGFSFSIANGIVFGVLSYVAAKLFAGKIKEVPIGLFILCVPLIYYLWLK